MLARKRRRMALKGKRGRCSGPLVEARRLRKDNSADLQKLIALHRCATPTAVLARQVLGAVAEFEKTALVPKLAAARRRKHMATGAKVEGRKSHVEARPNVVALAKRLARKKPKGAFKPAGNLGRTGRARPPQRARQALQPQVRLRHVGGMSASS
jgi:hypothetical protein